MREKKVYIKDESEDPIYSAKNKDFLIKSRVLPTILILGGITLLSTQVAYPLIFFKSKEYTKPVETSVLGYVSGFREFEFEELPKNEDSQNIELSNKDSGEGQTRHPEFFKITIPKLKIEEALVEVNAKTLNPDEALGHYTGSALPGEAGTSFIYGHSVLPWFYNPKNYKTIFSTLDQLETGDLVYIEINGKKLTYAIEGKEILKPNEVDPLREIKPRFLNESTITLMTCSPPGTKLKRLLVHGIIQRL
ncbi:sortase [Patescibacteria group bacterium]|nr:sortase [Patescibacteria group bacterium]HOM77650.1 sortase [bacterium]